MGNENWIEAFGAAMWELVERHTGRVGYKGGIKAGGLHAEPPVIDCSGWVALLLSAAMQAANRAADREVFSSSDVAATNVWSDRMVEELELRSGAILDGDRIAPGTLPLHATIGLQQGGGAWAANHPRPRGITHVVQVVRRPADLELFVSEAQGWEEPSGLRLTPLAAWMEETRPYLRRGTAWAVSAVAGRS